MRTADRNPELDLALRVRALEAENARLRDAAERDRPATLLGTSRSVRRLHEIVRRVASTPRTTVLVTGERGVGKETVAREIHRQSSRADGPFVALRCVALDREAFARGLVEAERGTLFLDEVCELSAELQVDLAAFLQERQIRREPSGKDEPIDVRIVAATCHDMTGGGAEHRLREDLVYRLNVLSIEVPPLRERLDDLLEVLRYELKRLGERSQERPRLNDGTVSRLSEHTWPGNLSELRNALERAALLTRGRSIEPEDLGLAPLPTPAASEPNGDPGDVLPIRDRSLRTVEEALVRRVLDETCGNRSRAARVLGVNRTTLYNKLKQYGIAEA